MYDRSRSGQAGEGFKGRRLGAVASGLLLAGCYAASSGLDTPPADPPPASGASEPSPIDPVEAVPQADGVPPAAEPDLDPCARRAEFVPLGAIPEGAVNGWRAVDPRSGYLYWSHELIGEGGRTLLFRWSLDRGISAIGAFDDLFVVKISTNGDVLVGSRAEGEGLGGGFRWSPSSGLTPVDFIPFALNDDGSVVVGASDAGLLRWTEATGASVIDAGAKLSVLGSLCVTPALDVVGGGDITGRAFRWTEATGSVDLGVFDEAVPIAVMQHLDASGEVLVGGVAADSSLSGSRAVRWTKAVGFQDLGLFPGAPEGAFRWPDFVSDDGAVIVGRVRGFADSSNHPFRWTEATGMQDLVPGRPEAYATYLSPSGGVVLGYFPGESDRGFRWTEATGAQDVEAVSWPGIGADGDLLVGTNAQGPFVRTFGALAGTEPELVRLAGPGLVPDGWSDARLQGVSNDGGLLFGEASNPNGEREGWVRYIREGCVDAD